MAGRALTYLEGRWVEGNPPILGPMDHATWMASLVFDGARAFEGVAPDLDRHCARLIASAETMGLGPPVTAEEVLAIARDGISRFPKDAELYVRPMMWASDGWIEPDPAATRFCFTIYDEPMPKPGGETACIVTNRRRPTPEMAPTRAKAACLYPQAGLAIVEAKKRGHKNAIMLDALGNVAEFATSNIFLGIDGAVHTPVPTGGFLAGITRQRVIDLLRADGVTVLERSITPDEVGIADEVFSTGNFGKVQPLVRVDGRDLQPGPFYRRARKLYWEFAHS